MLTWLVEVVAHYKLKWIPACAGMTVADIGRERIRYFEPLTPLNSYAL
jgi:hypothetical protein